MGTAGNIVNTNPVEELDRSRISTMILADSIFHFLLHLALLFECHEDQVSDSLLIEMDEGIKG